MTARPTFIALSVLLLFAIACKSTGLPRGESSDPVLARGAVLYRNACLSCHGSTGNGLGPVSSFLVTKPRDFESGIYKFRSTPTGTMPTTHDLVTTIASGVNGTTMPSFAALIREDTFAVAAYIQDLSRRAARRRLEAAVAAGDLDASELEEVLEEQMQPGAVIEIPDEPPMSQASVERGRAHYQSMECAKCHGPSGRGDGPSSSSLVDDWDHPIVPADFTIPGGIKGGSTARDIYRTFMTGMDGTPMPSYAEQLKPEEAWSLAHFVLWLRRQRETIIR